MKTSIKNKITYFIVLALIINDRAFAMNHAPNEAPSFQVSAQVKKTIKNPRKGFVNWVKNHKLISAVVPSAVAVAATAVGLMVWGINRNKGKDNLTKELKKAALKQEDIQFANIMALFCMDEKTKTIYNAIEQMLLDKFKDNAKKRMINDIKERNFKIVKIIDSTEEKTIVYSNFGLTEDEKDRNYELKSLTEEVSKNYYYVLNPLADVLESKKIYKNGEIAKDETYVSIHEFEIIDKEGTKVVKDLADILGFKLIKYLKQNANKFKVINNKDMAIDNEDEFIKGFANILDPANIFGFALGKKVEEIDTVIQPCDDFFIKFNNNNQECSIFRKYSKIKFHIYNVTNLITIECQIDKKSD